MSWCSSTQINSSAPTIQKNYFQESRLARIAVITAVVIGALFIGAGAGIFKTGTIAYACYGTGGGAILIGSAIATVMLCQRKKPATSSSSTIMPPPVIVPAAEQKPADQPVITKEAPPIEPVDPTPPPRQKTFWELLEEEKKLSFEQIKKLTDDLGLGSFLDSTHHDYSEAELNYDVQTTISLYPQIATDKDQQAQVLDHLKALRESLPYHLKGGSSLPNYPLTPIPNTLANNGYIHVGLQILTHTRDADYLLYRPLYTDRISKEDIAEDYQKARNLLRETVLSLRKGEAPSGARLSQINHLISTLHKDFRKGNTSGHFSEVLNLLKPFAQSGFYFRFGPSDIQTCLKCPLFVAIDNEKESLYLRDGEWTHLDGQKIVKTTSKKIRVAHLARIRVQQVFFQRFKPNRLA